MANRRVFILLPLITILLATMGCSSPPPTPTVVVATEDPSQLAPPPQGACGNRLYPVLVGATWTYALTGAPIHGTAVRSISAVTGDGFTDTLALLSGSSSTGEWRCRGGELTSVSVGAAVSFVASQPDMVYQIVDQNGVSLPATVRDGDTWAREIAFAGSGLITGEPVEATGNASIACSAGPTEQVVVPAGAFDAVPVVCTTDTILNLRSGDVDFPMSRSSSSTSWYALDLGLIKWDRETSEVGQITFELVSFSFP